MKLPPYGLTLENPCSPHDILVGALPIPFHPRFARRSGGTAEKEFFARSSYIQCVWRDCGAGGDSEATKHVRARGIPTTPCRDGQRLTGIDKITGLELGLLWACGCCSTSDDVLGLIESQPLQVRRAASQVRMQPLQVRRATFQVRMQPLQVRRAAFQVRMGGRAGLQGGRHERTHESVRDAGAGGAAFGALYDLEARGQKKIRK